MNAAEAANYIPEQARLARERGQGRFIPATLAQAQAAAAGAAALRADFPGRVRTGDELIGIHPYPHWRAAYETEYHRQIKINRDAGRTEPRDWTVTP